MQIPKLIAILGPTGSGKSDLALGLAIKLDAEIFSLDSLSIYKDIDILSAKPNPQELAQIKHYGINLLHITQNNNAMIFKNLLQEAIQNTKKSLLILVGGSSFYLKTIIDGLSPMPNISKEIRSQIQNLQNPYHVLQKIDPLYASRIQSQDTYRTTKALEIYFATSLTPTQYFATYPPAKFPYLIKVFCIDISKEVLRKKIILRTQKMLDLGGIQEIANLIKIYPKTAQPFKAIGPKECIAYLENQINYEEMQNQIITHTMQLAKRQQTFNRTQFLNATFLEKSSLFDIILKNYFTKD